MNILYVNHYRRFKNWRWGRSYALSRELVKRGHSVTLCLIADHEKFRVRSYEEEGIQIYEFPDLLYGRLRSGWDPWCLIRRILTFRSFGPAFDLIHCFETRPATIYPVLSYQKRYPIPLIIDWNDWWGRGGLITENRPRWYANTAGHVETYFEEAFRRHGDAHTVVSDGLHGRLLSLGVAADRIFKIPNGSDTEYFRPRDQSRARRSLGLPSDVPIMCFTGFDVLSDLDLVLSAFKKVCHRYPSAKLILTGRKTLQASEFMRANRLECNVIQLGYVNEDTLLNVMASSDVCLMPFRSKVSNIGRYPGKVSEYMSMGKAVVSNPVGEIGKLFSSNSIGVLCDETPEAFADAILELLADSEKRAQLGKSARAYAESTLSWKVLVEQKVETVYECVLANRAQAPQTMN